MLLQSGQGGPVHHAPTAEPWPPQHLGVGCADAEGRVKGTWVRREACKSQTCSRQLCIQSDLAAGFSTLHVGEGGGTWNGKDKALYPSRSWGGRKQAGMTVFLITPFLITSKTFWVLSKCQVLFSPQRPLCEVGNIILTACYRWRDGASVGG